MGNRSRETVSSKLFAHLSPEERLDKACELLAVGVLRLARQRGLLGEKGTERFVEIDGQQDVGLHQKRYFKSRNTEGTIAS